MHVKDVGIRKDIFVPVGGLSGGNDPLACFDGLIPNQSLVRWENSLA